MVIQKRVLSSVNVSRETRSQYMRCSGVSLIKHREEVLMKMKNNICPLIKVSSLGSRACLPDQGHFLICLMLAYLMREVLL